MTTSDLPFQWADPLGPAKVLYLTQPALGLRAVVAVDNVACGPSIGGVRMAPDVSAEEAFRLARAMTLKNAAAGLPHGGGKAVIAADPHMERSAKEEMLRAFACAIRDLSEYIPGPDMGTDERAMAWIQDEIGRAVGLPSELGGIPLDEIGATGFGLAECADVAHAAAGFELAGARVVIQGYGNVGRPTARFLSEKGARVIAVSDSRGTVVDEKGLDLDALMEAKRSGASVLDAGTGEPRPVEAVIEVPCDIWIPCARPDVVHAGNVDRLDTRLVLEGANIPITVEAEASLHARGVTVVPDFVANAGGVICAAVEYHGGTEKQAFEVISEKVRRNTQQVLETAARRDALPREAATALARERVLRAAALRRFHGGAEPARGGAPGRFALDL